MSAKPVTSAVLLALVMTATAGAQVPTPYSPTELTPPPSAAAPPAGQGPAASVLANGFNTLPNTAGARWANDGEFLRVGRDGPIGQEVYFHTGPTIPTGDGVLGLYLDTGWMAEAGGRALMFNSANTAAATVKLGLSFQYNHGATNAPTYRDFGFNDFTGTFFPIDVRTKDLIRWSGVVAIGRDWFRHGQAPFGRGMNTLRAGFDVGGRWGTQRLNEFVINDPVQATTFRHRSDVYGGVVTGLHVGFEVPMGGWVWHGGFRGEYGYNWSNMIPGQNSNLSDINLLLTTGFRY